MIALWQKSVQDDIDLIIAAHTHEVLPEGAWVGKIPIAQAGMYAEYLGRIDIQWDGTQATVQHISLIPVTDDIPPAERVLEEKHAIEQEVQPFLNEIVGELAEPLDFATDRECGTANLVADMLRERMNADIGLITTSIGLIAPLAAGPLTRKTLWDACPSSANPGVAEYDRSATHRAHYERSGPRIRAGHAASHAWYATRTDASRAAQSFAMVVF